MLGGDYSLNLEYIFYQIYHFIVEGGDVGASSLLAPLSELWFWMRFISIPLTFAFAILAIHLTRRIVALRHEERMALRQILESTRADKPEVNQAWQKVLDHMSSSNSDEWKLAIIEADNLLDHLVKSMNYPGESLGERLKNIEPSDFATLNDAWEGHKVRNRIAHESAYVPSENEARRAIANYRRVFEEFQII
jgi:hypothetical protein